MISLLGKNGFKSSVKTSDKREWALKDPLHGPVLGRAGGVTGWVQEQVAALQLGCPIPCSLASHPCWTITATLKDRR